MQSHEVVVKGFRLVLTPYINLFWLLQSSKTPNQLTLFYVAKLFRIDKTPVCCSQTFKSSRMLDCVVTNTRHAFYSASVHCGHY